MRPAIGGVDGIGKAEHRLVVVIGVLQSHLDSRLFEIACQVDRFWEDGRLVLVEMPYEGGDAPFEVKGALAPGGLLRQLNAQAAIQVRHLAKPLHHQVVIKGRVGEDVRIWFEDRLRSGALRGPYRLHLGGWDALGVFLHPAFLIALYLHPDPGRKRADHRDANAVQAAGNLIATLLELSSGVKASHDDFKGRATYFWMFLDRNAAAVVLNRYFVIGMQDNFDGVAGPGQGFVDTVIDDLVDKLLEPLLVCPSDVHAGPAADTFEPFEDLNICGPIGQYALLHAYPSPCFRRADQGWIV